MAEGIPIQIASMGVMPKYDWGDLPMEIVAKIHEHIELYDDYEAFLKVCSYWRLAIKNFPCQYTNRRQTQLPWLMLVDTDDSSYRRYYSLMKRMFLKIDLPCSLAPPQTRRYFSSRGWLISVSRNISKSTDANSYFNISIFNPFANNNVTIEAPLFHMSYDEVGDWEDDALMSLFAKFAVSVSPNVKDCDDFVVAMTFGGLRNIAYWRLGLDNTWNIVPYSAAVKNTLFQDLYFFNGELYATQWENRVIALGDLKDHPQPRLVSDLGLLKDCQLPANTEGSGHIHYLVESKYDQSDDEGRTSTLLFIYRFVVVESYDELKYHTSSFTVFKLNVNNGNVKRVKRLGNQAIFVGFNSTFSVVVDDECGGCKSDCIYYADDYTELYHFKNGGGGSDMGIYSMRTGNTVPVYEGPSRFSVINPPTWVEFCCT